MIQICVYLFILALFLMLGILSRNEKALLSESDSCVSRWLRRISVYQYRKHLRLRRKIFDALATSHLPFVFCFHHLIRDSG